MTDGELRKLAREWANSANVSTTVRDFALSVLVLLAERDSLVAARDKFVPELADLRAERHMIQRDYERALGVHAEVADRYRAERDDLARWKAAALEAVGRYFDDGAEEVFHGTVAMILARPTAPP